MENNTNTVKYQGVSQIEADEILKKDGFNELPSQKKKNSLIILLKIMSEPMLLLLVGAGVIYLFLGEIRDALLLVFSVIVVIGITFYQEKKTERTLEALKDLSSPRALVFRDGEQKRIAGKEVVKGDIIIIHEGDRIPADATILSCENLSVDESLLTGESIPVRKTEWSKDEKQPRPGGDDLPFVFSSTLVVDGRGVARVSSTGPNTEIGKIGKSLEKIKDEDTLLHKETKKIVRSVALVGIVLCIIVVLFYVFVKGNIMGGFLAGITLSMAILPEEFPVVLLVFLTLGAWRISKRKVLTRRSAAIETLGAATVLCTDKTGTLTLNKMELVNLYAGGLFYDIDSSSNKNEMPEQFKTLLEYGILASQKDPFDPIEKELKKFGNTHVERVKDLQNNFDLTKEYPLSKKLLALSHVWQSKDKKEFIIASKGAPEAILELCHSSDEQKKEILKKVKEMSEKGLRVLGVAKGAVVGNSLSDNQHDFDFEFIGLLGFVDPVRQTVPTAVAEAYEAGMRVIMITGDYPGTAQFVAEKIGIKNYKEYLTGEDLAKMSHLELKEKIKSVNIFARVVPEQKLLIIDALKANNEIVAMTGDGVNDAPALKSAHIGVAMGERGTDVAREASALVLLNDDFSSIVSAVRLGRRIYDNIKRSMGYLLAVHVPIAGMSLLPLIFDFPIVLLPAHVAFLELIIDPACSIAFESENEEKNIMKRPPRNLHEPMFNRKTIGISVIQGLSILIATFVLYFIAVKTGRSEQEIRSFAFVSLVFSNLMLIAINLSWDKSLHRILMSANRILFIILIGAILCLLAVLYVPFFSNLFHMAPLRIMDIGFIVLIVFISLFWFELFKLFKIKKLKTL
ncbi:MAG TPA: cation-translocating P-type ATPase [Candidatus Paceibacterota bacterium]|nr:cation-translocating P-type ATPase [Candidatus Paceibacterota bacterium]HPT17986.1 cation-translocating P-type ATPase [Candidatus Paceibacterota bacterium]